MFERAVHDLRCLGCGALMAKLDLKEAFCHIFIWAACYKWHAGLLQVVYCIVTGAMCAVMCGMSCNDGHGKPTMGQDDNGGSGG